jgi:uncharacterized protein involved in tellurium resistance
MSRPVANVDVITDSFEIWLLETNELLNALSTEIITANSTYANTGNTAFPRTAQLYGTFGANNLVVKDWMKGGNVNGSFANLMISTNTVLSNTTATEIRLEVANGSSNSFMWQYGLHAGLTGANLVANTTKLTIQSNATVNTTANATLISVANSTSSANTDAISFKTGLFVANTIQITLGANVTANATNGGTIQVTGSGAVGNSVSNSSGLYVGNTVTNSQITSVRFFAAEGSNTVLANNQIISIANTTSSANIDPISFKTGIFTANTIQVSLGANVTANATNGGTVQVTGTSTIGNTVANSSGLYVSNTLNSSQVTSVRFLATEGSNTTLANTRIISIANSIATANIEPNAFKTGIFTANTIQISLGANVTANATNGGTIQVTGTSTIGNTVANSSGIFVSNSLNSVEHSAVRFYAVEGSNTTLANTRIISIANATSTSNVTPTGFSAGIVTANQTVVAVGANVFANATSLLVGNSSFNTVVGNGSITASANLTITPTSHLVVVGAATVSSNVALANTLSVVGNTVLSNTLAVTGAATLSSTLGVTGAATLSNTIAVTGTASYANIVTFKTEHVVDVFANGNLGATTGSDLLVFEYPKADYSTAKLLIQLKNTGNTQISEVLLAHDTSSAQLTTYGTVSSPVSANSGVSLLGTFSANVATANVRVYVNQTRASTAAKVVAQFIK